MDSDIAEMRKKMKEEKDKKMAEIEKMELEFQQKITLLEKEQKEKEQKEKEQKEQKEKEELWINGLNHNDPTATFVLNDAQSSVLLQISPFWDNHLGKLVDVNQHYMDEKEEYEQDFEDVEEEDVEEEDVEEEDIEEEDVEEEDVEENIDKPKVQMKTARFWRTLTKDIEELFIQKKNLKKLTYFGIYHELFLKHKKNIGNFKRKFFKAIKYVVLNMLVEKFIGRIKIGLMYHYYILSDEGEYEEEIEDENEEDEDEILNIYDYIDDLTSSKILHQMELDGVHHYLIKGAVQSGKTALMIGAAYLSALLGISTVILVQKYISDVKQVTRRIEQTWKKYVKYMTDMGQQPKEGFDLSNPIIVKPNMSENQIQKLKMALTGVKPNIIVCMGNDTRISNLLEIMNDNDVNYQYNLSVDEIDTIYKSDELCAYRPQADELMSKAHTIIGVTATVFDVIIPPDNPFSTNKKTFIMPLPPNYKGFSQLIHHKLSDNVRPPTSKCIVDSITRKIYVDLLTKPLPKINATTHHPNNMLHKVSRYHDDQYNLQDYFKKDTTLTMYTSIVYNGNGCRIYFPVYKNKNISITIDNKISKKDAKGYYWFSEVGIIDIYDYLMNNGGVEKFPHVVCFAGDMAKRANSFVSSDNVWHLTGQFTILSSQADAANHIQSLRVCGVYKDNIPLTLYATEQFYEKCHKGMLLQDDILDQSSKIEDEQPINDLLKDLQINAKIVPIGPVCKGINLKNILDIIEDDQPVGTGTIYIIKNLKNQDYKNVVEEICELLETSPKKWVLQSEIIGQLTDDSVTNTEYRTKTKNMRKLKSTLHTDDENTRGFLLFKMDYLADANEERWWVRYNQ